tara:strand:- start:2654 stop:3292 length:639 start_codon:yes stop_codon:yes gene_type:complete
MSRYSDKDLKKMDKLKKLNIINGITGIKSANLIGTLNKNKVENCAIFSSTIHLGSDPALIGFISRPTIDTRRHTLENIKENGFYTISSITEAMAERAHYTSAKFNDDINEFERCGLETEYLSGFPAPFVKKSPIKIGMRYLESLKIEKNQTVLVIGELETLSISGLIIDDRGYINLQKGNICGIGGLNQYYTLKKKYEYPYARPEKTPEFKR